MDIASVSAVVAAGGVIVGVALAYQELRDLAKTRKVDFIMRIVMATLSKEFRQATTKISRNEYKSYEEFVNEAEIEAQQIGGFFEGLGLLIHKKLVDIDLVGDLWIPNHMWKKMKPYVEERRKRMGPREYEYFEYFTNETQKREQTLQAQP